MIDFITPSMTRELMLFEQPEISQAMRHFLSAADMRAADDHLAAISMMIDHMVDAPLRRRRQSPRRWPTPTIEKRRHACSCQMTRFDYCHFGRISTPLQDAVGRTLFHISRMGDVKDDIMPTTPPPARCGRWAAIDTSPPGRQHGMRASIPLPARCH